MLKQCRHEKVDESGELDLDSVAKVYSHFGGTIRKDSWKQNPTTRQRLVWNFSYTLFHMFELQSLDFEKPLTVFMQGHNQFYI